MSTMDEASARLWLSQTGNDPDEALSQWAKAGMPSTAANAAHNNTAQNLGFTGANASLDGNVAEFMSIMGTEEEIARKWLGRAANDLNEAMQQFMLDLEDPGIAPPSPTMSEGKRQPKPPVWAVDMSEQEWLRSEPNWKQRLGQGWEGVKILGKGRFGIAGHWR